MMTEPMRTPSLEDRYAPEVDIPRERQILHPGDHDVLLGRGGGTNSHPGNVNFRELVKMHKKRYLAATKMGKPKVAKEVVDLWRQLEPPGRFLSRIDEPKTGPRSLRDENIPWIEVDEKEARKKASQCLRERTVDVKDYLDQLREHQDLKTKEGVSKVIEEMEQNQGLDASTPDSTGSSSRPELKIPLSPPPGENTIIHVPDRPRSLNMASMRRTSMPVTSHSVTDGIYGGGMSKSRTQDRRTSLPAGGQKLKSNREIDYDLLMANHGENIHNAYTEVERSVNMSPTGMTRLQMQMQQQHLFDSTRARMLRAGGMPPMPEMSFPQNGMYGFGQQISLTLSAQEQLMQQQRFLAEQQHHILREQERLVRQEHIIAQLAQQGQSGHFPPPVAMAGIPRELKGAPPISLTLHSKSDPLATIEQVYSTPSHGLQLPLEQNINPLNRHQDHSTGTEERLQASSRASMAPKTSKSALKRSSEDSKPITRPIEQNTQESTGEDHPEYRKTLETYIANNQSSLGSLDLPDDSFDNSGTVNGVEADEWIEEQIGNNSDGMSISNRGSLRRDRTVARTKSNKSVDLMSLATGTIGSIGGGDQMSFAFSELDEQSVEIEDLSKSERENSKRPTKRSMSILSIGTAMSELSDFDLGDLEGL
jgi:hypothetical protein